jgi:capsular polysaccharide biosynthesis protein
MKLRTLPVKAYNKALRALSKLVPINTQYKPVGIINVSRSTKPDSVEYIEIKPPYTLDLDLTPQFIADCSPFIKPIISAQFPGDFVLGIRDGRVYSLDASNMAVITREGQLIEQVSFQWSDDVILDGKHNKIFRETIFKAPKKFKGNVFSLLAGGGAITYYYHWLFDAMPKFYLLQKAGLFDKIDFFLVPNYVHQYQKDFLRHFGVPPEKIINAELEKHIRADTLYVTSYVRLEEHQPKWTCDFIYNSFVKPGSKKQRNKRIYISRKDASVNRRIFNEDELIEMLKGFGFEILLLTNLTIFEQVEMFNAASIVIGAHGAGFSNLVFCEPGTKVLEFFPDKYVRHAYYDICNQRGAEYHYLLCQSHGKASNCIEGQKLNMTADIRAIKEKVEQFLSSP